MYDYYFVFRSLTAAQKAINLLKEKAIRAALVNTPGNLSSRGCSYAVKIKSSEAYAAAGYLRRKGGEYERIYTVLPGRPPEEVFL